MRLWSLHPSGLDAKGLVAAWREALLAQAVLAGKTKGYRRHPQLERFRAAGDPRAAIACFLQGLKKEADSRGYRFNGSKIRRFSGSPRIPVNRGQLAYEYGRLLRKLADRDPEARKRLVRERRVRGIRPHPLFIVRDGGVEPWEKIKISAVQTAGRGVILKKKRGVQ